MGKQERQELVLSAPNNKDGLTLTAAGMSVPVLVGEQGKAAAKRFATFFTDDIRNSHTRTAYHRAAMQFFDWCLEHRLEFQEIESVHVAAYREVLNATLSPSSVKQHLAAIRKLYDWLVTGQVVPINPAHAVRGPRHVVTEGLTPILKGEDCQKLLASINTGHVVGLRDRALIALMTATFARVHAAVSLDVGSYFPEPNGKNWSVRLAEKNGKIVTMPVHDKLQDYLDAYLDSAEIREEKKFPLFRTARGRSTNLTEKRMTENDALRMVKRRAKAAGIATTIGNHTFRGTGITNFLENGGDLETAQRMANHSSAKTTKLYDRRNQDLNRQDVDRISAIG